MIGDFRVGQVAALPAQLNECAHRALPFLVLQRHGRGVHRQQDRDCLALRRAPTRSFPRGCGRVGWAGAWPQSESSKVATVPLLDAAPRLKHGVHGAPRQ
jgi:hypothetical protein